MTMTLKKFEGKHVFLKLYPNSIYNGVIKEVEFTGYKPDGSPIYLISMIDKYGKFIGFSSMEIKFIEEQNPKLEVEK